MIKRYAFLLIALLLTLPSFAEDLKDSALERVLASNTIRCGYFTWPPYFSKDPNTGKLSGINHDQVEALGRELNLKIEWTAEIGAGEVAQALNSGKIDMMCASIWPDPGRMRLLTLTKPMFYTPAFVYVRADEKRFKDYASLDNEKVQFVGIEGDVTYSSAKNNFPKAKLLALPQNSDASLLLLNLSTGKADAAIVDKSFADDFMKTNPGKIKMLLKEPVIVYPEYYAVKQGEASFKNMIDAATEVVINSGQAKKIVEEYKANSYPSKPSY